MKTQLRYVRRPNLNEYPSGSIPLGYSVILGKYEDWKESLDEALDFFCEDDEDGSLFAIYEREGINGQPVLLYSRWLNGCWNPPFEMERPA